MRRKRIGRCRFSESSVVSLLECRRLTVINRKEDNAGETGRDDLRIKPTASRLKFS